MVRPCNSNGETNVEASARLVHAIRAVHAAAIILITVVLTWALTIPSDRHEVLIYSRRHMTFHIVQAAILMALLLTFRRSVHKSLARHARPIGQYVLIVFGTLVLLEAAIRVLDPLGISDINNQRILWRDLVRFHVPPVGKSLYPNVHIKFRGWSVTSNSYGFRDDAFPERKPSEEKRILMLGDSYLFGHGVEQDGIAAALLEKKLGAATGHPWQAINTGVGSYATHEQRVIVDTYAERFRVDAVLLLYCFNDCQSRFIAFSPVHDIPEYVPHTALPLSVRGEQTSAYWTIRTWLGRIPPVLRPWTLDYVTWWRKARQQAPGGPPLDENNWAWRLSRDNLVLIKQRCDELGIPFVIAYLNSNPTGSPECFAMRVSAALRKVCTKHEIAYYDLREPALEHGLFDHPNSRVDGHPNAKGQEILADLLFDVLHAAHICNSGGSEARK